MGSRHFLCEFSDEEECLSKIMQEHGYPKKHPHRLACLRQELIEAFVEYV